MTYNQVRSFKWDHSGKIRRYIQGENRFPKSGFWQKTALCRTFSRRTLYPIKLKFSIELDPIEVYLWKKFHDFVSFRAQDITSRNIAIRSFSRISRIPRINLTELKISTYVELRGMYIHRKFQLFHLYRSWDITFTKCLFGKRSFGDYLSKSVIKEPRKNIFRNGLHRRT